eukprot:TRINITY_DN5399_c0_g1_i1.p1 TRINITY_DN5399_c0_g1~~TRINITY_DN5399_c0_g1_i1.p1  ORF type:complete len:300 (-),score=61.17 TRINITY_DN5399_c0_g1_i1:59-958(-)
MDIASKAKEEEVWRSKLKEGILNRDVETGKYTIEWGPEYNLKTSLNEKGRGFELSELIHFNNMLLSCDDRTGIVYELMDFQPTTKSAKAVPRYILTNGDGNKEKGFKCEWATVYRDKLYIGSVGKEWSDNKGNIVNYDPFYVKTIDAQGHIEHKDWTELYKLLREKTETSFPDGYMMHEAAAWWPKEDVFVFAPRRVAQIPYDEEKDETQGSNLFISVDPLNWSKITTKTIGKLNKELGFSSIKFIPWREHEAICLKTKEHKGEIETYIFVANVETGDILMEEQLIDKVKFEGLEFLFL